MILVLTSGDLRIDYAQRVQISLTPQHSAREVRPLTTPLLRVPQIRAFLHILQK